VPFVSYCKGKNNNPIYQILMQLFFIFFILKKYVILFGYIKTNPYLYIVTLKLWIMITTFKFLIVIFMLLLTPLTIVTILVGDFKTTIVLLIVIFIANKIKNNYTIVW
jgi:hypothetical protein